MIKHSKSLSALVVLGAALVGGAAHAHVAVVGPVYAGTTQEVTFTVGHGCSGLDTYSVRVEIPEAITSVRSVSSTLGPATLELDAAQLVSAVTWTKDQADVLDGDTAYYKMTLRLRIPDAPFSQLHFKAGQTCRSADGQTEEIAEWTTIGGEHGGHEEEGAGPAASVNVVPARAAGWNKYTVAAAMDADALASFFADAQIVWLGTAAYSANPVTTEQIAATEGVTTLGALAANDEIWVKY